MYQADIQEALTEGITSTVDDVLTHLSLSQVSVQYAFTVTSGGCSNTEIVTAKINPTPRLSSTQSPSPVCSNNLFHYSPSSNMAGVVTFNWSRKEVVGISNSETAGIGDIDETLINTTSSPIIVIYEYQLNTAAVNCPNIQTVSVTVNPTPLLTSVTPLVQCSGSAFNFTPTSSISGSTFTWQRNAVYGISNIGASGTYDPALAGAVSLAEILVDTLTTAVNVPYTFTVKKSGTNCTSTQVVIMVVKPVAVIDTLIATICSNTTFSAIPKIVPAGTVYTWLAPINTTAGAVNLGSLGTSQSTIGQLLTNTTPYPAILTYRVTPTTTTSGTSCPGIPFVVQVTVNPIPSAALSSYTAPAICSGNPFIYAPPVLQTGTTYSWPNPIVSPNSTVTGTDSKTLQTTINSSILTNLTKVVSLVTYDVRPIANGCTGPNFTVLLNVNPAPTINTQLATICSGGTFTVDPSLDPLSIVPNGTWFVWDTPLQTPAGSIEGAEAKYTQQASISQTLTNTTFDQSVVQYLVSATSPIGNCTAPNF